MKIRILILLLFSAIQLGFSQATVEWIERLNGYEYMGSYPDFSESQIKLDPSRNIITAGAITYYSPFGTLYGDSIYIAKYTNNGILQWYKTLKGNEAIINSLDVDSSGNSFVIGNHDLSNTTALNLILAYDPSGNLIWSDSVDAGNAYGINFIKVMDDQNILSISSITIPLGYTKIHVRKYSPMGNIIFQHTLDSASFNSYALADVFYTNDNETIIAAFNNITGLITVFKLDSTGNGYSSFDCNCPTAINVRSVYSDSLKMIYLTGDNYNSGSLDIYVAKFDSLGINSWYSSFDIDSSIQSVSDMILDNSGNIYACGLSHNNSTAEDICLLKYLPNGQLDWFKTIDTTGNDDFGYSLKIDQSGYLYLLGRAHILNESSYLMKFNSSGGIHWVETYNYSLGNDKGSDFTLDDSSNIYLTGYSQSNSAYNLFIIKYSQIRELSLASKTNQKNNVTIYPNPTNRVINIGASKVIIDISIYNTQFKELFYKELNGLTNILIPELAEGLYFIKINLGEEVITEKLLIER